MADIEIQRLESYQYPNTHVGHISPEHNGKLAEFKSLCEKKGYYKARGDNGMPSHDDETMLRYLRARKFVPADAYQQFKDTEDWRKENQIDKLYDTIDVAEYDQSRRLYPQWTGRRDRRGIPVYLFEVAHLNAKAVAAHESSSSSKSQIKVTSKVPPKMLRLFALYENLVNFALPLCSSLSDRPYPETPVSQSNNIVDISNVGLRQFWSLKSHMQDASQLATAHYPETLDRIFIIGAPSFFPTVWGWVKRWFDPITVSKIFILSNADMKSTLEQYIDPENIPTQYGGKLQYKFGDLPNLDPAIQKTLKWDAPEKVHGANTFPTGPVKWQRYEHGDLAAIAVGSQNGKLRNTKVATLHPAKDVAQTSLGVSQAGHLFRTTTGLSTHPPAPAHGQEEHEDVRPSFSDDDSSRNASISGPSTTGPSIKSSTAGHSTTASTSTAITSTAPSFAFTPANDSTALRSSTSSAAPFIAPIAGTGATGGTFLNYKDLSLGTTNSPNQSHVADTSRAGTSTLPYRVSPHRMNTIGTTDSEDNFEDAQDYYPSTDRQGTSSTRYTEQSHTHAHGNVASGTPIKAGTQGDHYGVMEPNTVGQAPKEHPMPSTEDAPAPGYLEQAKALAGQAYGTATSVGTSALAAVGVVAKPEEEPVRERSEASPRDSRIDDADPAQVEDYLRSRVTTHGQK